MTEKLLNINEILNSIQKHIRSPKEQKNSFGNYNYRKAEDILEVYKEEIKKEIYPRDLTLKHRLSVEAFGNRLFLKCVSVLSSGKESEEAEGYAEIGDSQKGMTPAQLSGAVTSYAKKYALGNLFVIDDSKDDPDASEDKSAGQAPIKPKPNTSKASSGNAADVPTKEGQKKAAATYFAATKKAIDDCATLPVLEALILKEKPKLDKLQKFHLDLFDRLMESAEVIKSSFNQQ